MKKILASESEVSIKKVALDSVYLVSFGLPIIVYGLLRGITIDQVNSTEVSDYQATHHGLTLAFCYIFGFNVCKIVTFLQICHAGELPFFPMRLLQKFQNVALIVVMLLALMNLEFSYYLVYLLVAIAMIDYLAFCFVGASKIAQMLGIKVVQCMSKNCTRL